MKYFLTFNWRIKRLCNADHDIGAKHPEYVVKEEATEQNTAVHDFVHLQKFNAAHGKRQTKYVIGYPML